MAFSPGSRSRATNPLERINRALSGRYIAERELGRGGTAIVYLAEDLKHRRKVAIKVLRPEIASAVVSKRFLREIATAARLQHPHIVPLYDSGKADDLLYFVMPFVEGETLAQRLHRERQLPIDVVARITRAVALALDFAHAHGVVHRDVKPGNILLVGDEAMVADFGIAHAVSVSGGERLTQSGIVFGTPLYMSPEQAEPGSPDSGLSDQYSLACVVYEMLVGVPPFQGSGPAAIFARHSLDPMPSIRTVRAMVPPGVEAAIERALAKVPADRFPTASRFAEAVAAAAVQPPQAGIPARRRMSRGGLLATIAGTVAVLTAAGYAAARTFRPTASGRAADIATAPRVAVLPFDNLGKAEDQYFADGLTDELTTRVADIRGIGVIARRSAMQYSRQRAPVKAIARALGADYLLAGTIRTDRRPDSSGTTRVSAELIYAPREQVVWRGERNAALRPGDLLSAESAIAESVAASLNTALAERRGGSTNDLVAYEDYLRGNVYSAPAPSLESARLAVAAYQRAAARDPHFVLALARLAQLQSVLYDRFERTPAQRQRADSAVRRLVATDTLLPASRVALGFYHYWVLRDFEGAKAYFDDVRATEPNNAELLSVTGTVLRSEGKWDSALVIARRAAELDPRSSQYAYDAGKSAAWRGRYDEADRFFQKASAIDPNAPLPYLSRSYLAIARNGDIRAARRFIDDAAAHIDTTSLLVALIPRSREHIAILEEPWQDALDRLSLRAAAVDSGEFYLAKAELYGRRGSPKSRAYFDSARVVFEPRVRAHPDEPHFRAELGLALAGMGRTEAGIAEGVHAVQLVPESRDAVTHADLVLRLVRTYIVAGRYDAAIAELERETGTRLFAPVAALRTYPVFAPLWRLPRFQALTRSSS